MATDPPDAAQAAANLDHLLPSREGEIKAGFAEPLAPHLEPHPFEMRENPATENDRNYCKCGFRRNTRYHTT
jgi:hypothetical protein